jgi:hypothetical protein
MGLGITDFETALEAGAKMDKKTGSVFKGVEQGAMYKAHNGIHSLSLN